MYSNSYISIILRRNKNIRKVKIRIGERETECSIITAIWKITNSHHITFYSNINFHAEKTITASLSPRLTINSRRVLRISGSVLKLVTSNVRSLVENEKLENILKEMKRLKLYILEVSDTRWRKSSNFIIRNSKYKIYYSISNELRHGV